MALPQQHEKDSVGNGAEATSKLASYEPPKSGLLSRVPPSWVPYGELMRINKPAGIYLVYFHHLFGTLYGACVSEVPPSLSRLVFINVVLFIGSIFERSAGCAWNDYIDQDIDRKVTRTRLRPIARGAISTMQAFFLTLSLALLCLGCMQLLPSECLLTSVPAQILLLLYPYAKRVTNVPSAVLGSQLALGIVLGMTAMGCGPLNAPELWDGKMWTAIGTFYLANVVWIVFCDSIYSHQDIKDDLKAGVKSIAVKYRDHIMKFLSVLGGVMIALLVTSGLYSGFGLAYFLLSCAGPAIAMAITLFDVDLTNPKSCAWWFINGTYYVGLPLAGGLFAECALQLRP